MNANSSSAGARFLASLALVLDFAVFTLFADIDRAATSQASGTLFSMRALLAGNALAAYTAAVALPSMLADACCTWAVLAAVLLPPVHTQGTATTKLAPGLALSVNALFAAGPAPSLFLTDVIAQARQCRCVRTCEGQDGGGRSGRNRCSVRDRK